MAKHHDNPTRILVVDDHVILRDGIVSLLQSQPDFEVVGEAGTIAEALSSVRKTNPDLVLMDYSLPDGTGIDAAKAILASHPETSVVFLTVHEDDDRLFAAIRTGAKGYLLKNIPAMEMLEKLRGLSRGEAPISRRLAGRVLEEFAKTTPAPSSAGGKLAVLTSRELEVVHTVKNHVHNILEKLEVGNRRAAAALALKHGLVRPRKD
jgi:DNA-binding NarL/FixJ family response regulator